MLFSTFTLKLWYQYLLISTHSTCWWKSTNGVLYNLNTVGLCIQLICICYMVCLLITMQMVIIIVWIASFSQSSEGGSAGRPSRPSLRDNFVPSSAHRDYTGQPRRGPIVFVRGQGINEDMLKETFTKEGLKIIEIRMEIKRQYVWVINCKNLINVIAELTTAFTYSTCDWIP